MSETENFREFTLLGGPTYRLGCRFGLVLGRTNMIPLGLALAGISWSVLLILAFVEGAGSQILSVSALAGHVRLLVAIPLFFICETRINPRIAAFVHHLVDSAIVRRDELPALESIIARIFRWRDSWLPEITCLLASILLFLIFMKSTKLSYYGMTATPGTALAIGEMSLTGQWYWIVCLPLYRFLMLRWLWHLALWCYFLWRLSKMNLHLVPTHPDGAAGLGFLEVVHLGFSPLALAFSAVLSATFAEDLSINAIPFDSIYPALFVSFLIGAALFVFPLCIFFPKLRACKINGWVDYMRLGSRYVNDFDRKWLRSIKNLNSGETLLGTPDIQSLADLNNSVSIVRSMRLVPISVRLVSSLGLAVVLPLLPLLLFIYPFTDLIKRLFAMVLGL